VVLAAVRHHAAAGLAIRHQAVHSVVVVQALAAGTNPDQNLPNFRIFKILLTFNNINIDRFGVCWILKIL